MAEQEIREPRATYVTSPDTAVTEQALEPLQVTFPPYFDRFLNERDKWLTSEFKRLGEAIEHNSAMIARILQEMERRFSKIEAEMERRFSKVEAEMDRRFAEAKEERENLWAEMNRRFAEAKKERENLWAEMNRRFAEARAEREELRAEIKALRQDMRTHFRWTIGLLLPIALGVVSMIIRALITGIP